jgi:DNA-binding transcriptional ArsR family regulator
MITYSPYKAIADNTRRQILDLLRRENLTAGVIVERVRRKRLSRTAISKHLRILRQSRLVLVKKKGRERIYTINAQPLREVNTWLKEYEAFWDQQLQAFKDYVESETE